MGGAIQKLAVVLQIVGNKKEIGTLNILLRQNTEKTLVKSGRVAHGKSLKMGRLLNLILM